ncbi:AraC family transcriptional regulator [Parafrankia sp. BMG5.11]|uniref:helix-turn-helix domain-containing protein n=1 Tax=Parafrankia sp. BMG5.11 TaxID=222540 RepID=UPI00103B5FA3|nr:helix-turn-helix transcriptional regulator [Parafrankia sp. BMG5.11]TCJ37004.1 AraC family transcriptional regulator [Parafrankia sp. BMG5.11]
MVLHRNLEPTVLASARVAQTRIELVEWRWPTMFEWERAEDELMLEMSLPPLSEDASACFSHIDGERSTYMGTLFVRYPGVHITGRSAGGHIRVLRWILPEPIRSQVLGLDGVPELEVLQSLLNIRNETLRTLMRLAHRELLAGAEGSAEALAALHELVVIELRRLFLACPGPVAGGRLAAWQYRRIRERLAQGPERPTVAELAALCGISSRHLHRQFHALTGEPISHYIESFLMMEAKSMLTARGTPVKAVARACGFSHANSFSRAFRRVTGVTPQQFRQRAHPAPQAF